LRKVAQIVFLVSKPSALARRALVFPSVYTLLFISNVFSDVSRSQHARRLFFSSFSGSPVALDKAIASPSLTRAYIATLVNLRGFGDGGNGRVKIAGLFAAVAAPVCRSGILRVSSL